MMWIGTDYRWMIVKCIPYQTIHSIFHKNLNLHVEWLVGWSVGRLVDVVFSPHRCDSCSIFFDENENTHQFSWKDLLNSLQIISFQQAVANELFNKFNISIFRVSLLFFLFFFCWTKHLEKKKKCYFCFHF